MIQNELSAKEKTQTVYIVPPTKYSLNNFRLMDIKEILISFKDKQNILENPIDNDITNIDNSIDSDNSVWDRIYKISSFGIFEVDRRPAIGDTKKLQYIYKTVNKTYSRYKTRGNTGAGSAEV